MSADTTASRCLGEMDYDEVGNQFGRMSSVSIPCQLRFETEPDQNTERLHEALKIRGYSHLDTDPDRRQSGDTIHYDGEFCSQDHYNRISVFAGRKDMVRVYPLDGYVPTEQELTKFISGLEAGFNASLVHDPIEGGDSE